MQSRWFAVAFMVITLIMSPMTIDADEPIECLTPLSFPPSTHSVISITNETSLLDNASREGWPGIGSAGDPFIIDGYSIDAEGGNHSILIQNTASHIVVSNCSLYNATYSVGFINGVGLGLYNVENVTAKDNKMFNNTRGLFAQFVSNMALTSNSLFNNSQDGAYIDNIERLVVRDNDLSGNSNYGMRVMGSSGSDIQGNRFHGHQTGMSIQDSDGSHVAGNNITDTSYIGASIYSSDHVNISSNRIDRSGSRNVEFNACHYIFFSENRCNRSGGDGMIVTGGVWGRFENNSIYDNVGNGISISYSSHWHTVKNNDIHGNIAGIYSSYDEHYYVGNDLHDNDYGIQFYRADRNLIEGNDIHDNTVYGIYIQQGNDNKVVGNHVRKNHDSGMFLEKCQVSIASGNTLKSNNNNGLVMIESHQSTIKDNIIMDSNAYGIVLSESSLNDLQDNLIQGNRFHGLIIYSSNGNTMINNSFLYNNGAGDKFMSGRVQASDNWGTNRFNSSDGYGNYWRDWRGPDSDGDEVVDQPYQIAVGSAADLYPRTSSPMPVIPPTVSNVTAIVVHLNVTVSWDPVEEPDVDEIVIYRMNGTDEFFRLAAMGSEEVSFEDAGLAPGMYFTYCLVCVNGQGQSPRSRTVQVLPDDTIPSLTILTPENGSFHNGVNVTITWEGTDPVNPIMGYLVKTDGSDHLDVGLETSFVWESPEEGFHRFEVTCHDEAQNWNSAWIDLTVDRTPPVLTSVFPGPGAYLNNTTVRVFWSASDGISPEISQYGLVMNGQEVNIEPGVTYHTFEGMEEGKHKGTIRALDEAGNRGEVDLDFTVDVSPPELLILSPANGTIYNRSDLKLAWSSNDTISGTAGFRYRYDGGSWMDIGSYLNVTIDFLEGHHWAEVEARDLAGNHISRRVSFMVDISRPEVISHSPEGVDVPVDTSITVVFSEEMDRDATLIRISGVIGLLQWRATELTFKPSDPLEYDTLYMVSVEGADIGGSSLPRTEWSFKTTNTGTLKGKVLTGSRLPLEGGSVLVGDEEQTVTDASGIFELTLPAGAYAVEISYPGYDPLLREVEFEPGEVHDMGTLTMVRTVLRGTISGRVVDEGGKPVFGAIVTMSNGETATTDGSGLFSMISEVGEYTFMVTRDGFNSGGGTVVVLAGQDVNVGDVRIEKEGRQVKDDGSDLDLIYIQLALALALILIAVAVFLFLRRNREMGMVEE